MIAVDTNVLIYAHRGETELHRAAADRLTALAEGTEFRRRDSCPVSRP